MKRVGEMNNTVRTGHALPRIPIIVSPFHIRRVVGIIPEIGMRGPPCAIIGSQHFRYRVGVDKQEMSVQR